MVMPMGDGIVIHVPTLSSHALLFRSSQVPLFKAVYLPIFAAPDAAIAGSFAWHRWRELLHEPTRAFRRDGEVHQQLLAFRRAGGKLHTTCYLCHPPKGSSGEEYVW